MDESKQELPGSDNSRKDATVEELATYMKPAAAVQREFVRFTRLQRTLHGCIVIRAGWRIVINNFTCR